MSELDIREKIGILTAKVEAAHARVDKVEADINDSLKELHSDLKELNAHMNRGKGWAAAMMLLAGIFGGGVVKLFSLMGK